ncbi:DUF4184 family protein [Flammeovirga sp. SJP92]|uniref:DUF4184 family protein n=1 Tax=Flammeovirga sp. SJP92 TaxID=1775430 RepID=UPI0007970D9A|nr:DUF4184 family protein [Flammeovirga sp. SJP92]KXX67309.1 hypothetical protein AVL50_28415 [Flammeovirga sp. SJP92]
MPITFAHPSAVLPLFRYSHYLSVSALIIGSVIPDFEHYLQLQQSVKLGHTILGIFVFNLPVGILVYYINKRLFKPVLRRVTPIRFKRQQPRTQYSFFQISLSIFIGVITHFLLDAITGEEGFFVKDLPYLMDDVNVTPNFKMNIHNIIWVSISLFGTIQCIWLGITAFDLNNSLVKVKFTEWFPAFWVELIIVLFLVIFIRNLILPKPLILWDWGIAIGGAFFYALTFTCFRWRYFLKMIRK